MNLSVRAQSGSGAELYRWLIDDAETSSSVSIGAADSTAGEMGIGYDILSLFVPNAIALGNLIVAVATYRASRQQSTGSAPQISIGNGDTFVIVDGDGGDAMKALLRRLENP